jgi:glutamyl-Q tRNA(Asp) synthetase
VSDGRPTFRFAPSPTGELHIGHALSALTGWQWAKRLGGRFLLRIEDIDTGRARQKFTEQIFDDLAWLAITWEEPVMHQSDRFDAYRAQTDRLLHMGLLYPCFATRKEIKDAVAERDDHPLDPDGAPLYPGLHKGLTADEIDRRKEAGQPFALRLDMSHALSRAREIMHGAPITYAALDATGSAHTVRATPERWGDVIIVRKDVPSSYHLAVTIDDAQQGITHVTRGLDLEAATDVHRLLQVLLGLPAPRYHHHRLLHDAAGDKLSKSLRAESLHSLRAKGMSANDVLGKIGEIAVPAAAEGNA